ncbi:hypothetical protein TNCV_2212321 [Trichonephila clavipes]|nr:hypothetical protein TNCV_2212321 [Trichonephila clavipes]
MNQPHSIWQIQKMFRKTRPTLLSLKHASSIATSDDQKANVVIENETEVFGLISLGYFSVEKFECWRHNLRSSFSKTYCVGFVSINDNSPLGQPDFKLGEVVGENINEIGWKFKINHFVDQSFMSHSVECFFYIQEDADGIGLGVEPMDNIVDYSEELMLCRGFQAKSALEV